MYYLIYISSAATAMDESQLRELLDSSREKNERMGITGLMLYKSGSIMQLLEGDESRVTELYENIRRDSRHRDVYRVQVGTTQNRMFDDWSMGFCDVDKDCDLPAYHELIDSKLAFRSFENSQYNALRFMKMFSRRKH